MGKSELEKYFLNAEPDELLEEICMTGHNIANIESKLLQIIMKQYAMQEKLGILHNVEQKMTDLQNISSDSDDHDSLSIDENVFDKFDYNKLAIAYKKEREKNDTMSEFDRIYDECLKAMFLTEGYCHDIEYTLLHQSIP